jgi:hypothetical protein
MIRRQKLMSFLLIKINFFSKYSHKHNFLHLYVYTNKSLLYKKKIKPIEFSFNFKIKYRKFYYYNQVLCAFIMRKKRK